MTSASLASVSSSQSTSPDPLQPFGSLIPATLRSVISASTEPTLPSQSVSPETPSWLAVGVDVGLLSSQSSLSSSSSSELDWMPPAMGVGDAAPAQSSSSSSQSSLSSSSSSELDWVPP